MSHEVKILYFASASDATGMEFESIAAVGLTLAELGKLLMAKHGEKLTKVLQSAIYAVDMEYVDKSDETSTILRAGSEVAIIPPVSGG